jgi:hypothetical protein
MNAPDTNTLNATPPLTRNVSKHSETGQLYLDVKDSAGNAWFTVETEGGWEQWRQYLSNAPHEEAS